MNNNGTMLQWRRGIWALPVAILFCFTSFSCAMKTRQEEPSVVVDRKESASQKIALAQIQTNGQAYADRLVTVTGVFKGWKGPCATSVAITRSDWILADGTACIYVSGGPPPGVSAARPKDERIEVTGKITFDAKGAGNLNAMEIKVFH